MQEPGAQMQFRATVKPRARYLIGTADPTLGKLLARYLELAADFAHQEGVTVFRTEVGAYHDPEENRDQLLVSQWVKLPEDAAVDYWDRLGTKIEDWVNGLDDYLADMVAEWIALEVRPHAADAAA